MAKKPRNNPHGYKVCYKEAGDRQYTRYFLTYTYRQASEIIAMYVRYPPPCRVDNHILNNPKWAVIPVTPAEVRSGIWREVPF